MRSVHCPDAPHSITISVEKHAGVHVSVGVDVEILLASGDVPALLSNHLSNLFFIT